MAPGAGTQVWVPGVVKARRLASSSMSSAPSRALAPAKVQLGRSKVPPLGETTFLLRKPKESVVSQGSPVPSTPMTP